MIRRWHLSLGLIMAVVGACSLMSSADEKRAEALARDPIFGRLGQTWEERGSISVSPNGPNSSTGGEVVRQAFGVGDVADPLADMRSAASILEEEGWIDLVANCESFIISGRKADDYGYVSGRIEFVQNDSLLWLGVVGIYAARVDEDNAELEPRGQDLSCLSIGHD